MTNTNLVVSLWLLDEVTRLRAWHMIGAFVKFHFLSSRGIRRPQKPRAQHIWNLGVSPSLRRMWTCQAAGLFKKKKNFFFLMLPFFASV